MTRRAIQAVLLLALLAPVPTIARDKSVEMRLQALESRMPDADRLAALERTMRSSGMSTLVDDLNQLQKEVRALRGEIEKLSHELQAQRERDQRFHDDLDRRLKAVEQRSAPTTAAAITPEVMAPSSAQPAPPAAPGDEQAEYAAAFDLLKQGHYDRATAAFTTFLQRHPNGSQAGNAQYWLGEAHYVNQRYPEALAAFEALLQRYPESQKVPGAMLKIGYIHYDMKNYRQARDILESVREKYADSSVSGLAAERLERMRKEGV